MELDFLQGFFKRVYGRWERVPNDQNYYVKISFALISAVICGVGGSFFAGIRGLMFGLLVYVAALFALVYLIEIDVNALGGRQKLITSALPSYLLLWVLFWTLLYAFTL
ncbi:MAG: hypothetical protein RTU09_09460 [Candidatus Thorarchaeota archaeon]